MKWELSVAYMYIPTTDNSENDSFLQWNISHDFYSMIQDTWQEIKLEYRNEVCLQSNFVACEVFVT